MSAVDWQAVPGPAGWYEPDCVEPALRALAAATSVREASAPSSVLHNTGLLHEHSGTVYPAAAFAAPALLDIVEHGHPVVRVIAADLLTQAMECGSPRGPHSGGRRTGTGGSTSGRSWPTAPTRSRSPATSCFPPNAAQGSETGSTKVGEPVG